MEDPAGSPRRLPRSPRKASSCSGKERTAFIIKNNNLCEQPFVKLDAFERSLKRKASDCSGDPLRKRARPKPEFA
ncbi:hypothetical protein HMPREF3291_20395 [Bacillus sp. HMSC76G11]|nr:hypothetical protein HMPREF3291_20395 [Bacillus sp. HMSC76G11]